MENKKFIKPSNQKSVYNTSAIILEKLMTDEIPFAKAEVACNLLSGMNRTFALELKRVQITKEPLRVVESSNFVE